MIPAFGFGPTIIVNDDLFTTVARTQVRFPRSKSKRIRRKWAKQERNWRTTRTVTPGLYRVGPMPTVFGGMTEPYYVCDSGSYAKLQASIGVLQ